jgi:4-oxalmesaconate hydratase
MIGATPGVDPESGFYWEDTKRYIDALGLPEEDRRLIFEENVRTVYPRLGLRLARIDAAAAS